MNTGSRIKKIEEVLNKKFDPERLYYPIQPIGVEPVGVPADKNGMPPLILSLLDESEEV